ncbi:hypothetical protein CHS0354_029264, partial [Potamilus streckersoni]
MASETNIKLYQFEPLKDGSSIVNIDDDDESSMQSQSSSDDYDNTLYECDADSCIVQQKQQGNRLR